MNASTHRRSNAAGFTLVEILVAIVVVSLGLLGVAAMQATTMRNSNGSLFRTQANLLANDMADRLRANLEGAMTVSQTVGAGYNRPRTQRNDSGYTTEVAACRSVGCPPADLALDDLAAWNERILAALPGGTGVVCIDSGSATGAAPSFNGTTIVPGCDGIGTTFAIRLFWLDNRLNTSTAADTTGAYSVFTTRVSPL